MELYQLIGLTGRQLVQQYWRMRWLQTTEETMETMRVLPNVGDRPQTGGAITLGYDRVVQIRQEHSTLVALAAVLCGCPSEKVTSQHVQTLVSLFQNRAAEAPFAEVLACTKAAVSPTTSTPVSSS